MVGGAGSLFVEAAYARNDVQPFSLRTPIWVLVGGLLGSIVATEGYNTLLVLSMGASWSVIFAQPLKVIDVLYRMKNAIQEGATQSGEPGQGGDENDDTSDRKGADGG